MGERTPDPLDSFSPPQLRIHQSDGDDGAAVSPSSRYSSFGADSEFDRYCSATSLMGTPSVCGSAVTLFNDFSDAEFASGLENFSLGGGRAEPMTHENDSRLGMAPPPRSLRYGSSGLEMYGDGGDELSMMTVLDSSELLGFRRSIGSVASNDRNENDNDSARIGSSERYVVGNSDGSLAGGLCCKDGGMDGFAARLRVEVGGREVEKEEEGGLSDCEHSEGGDSMCVLGNSYGKLEGGLCCEDGAGRMDRLDVFDERLRLEVGEREVERGEEGGVSDFEHSKGEDSIYNYGSDDGGGGNRNESFMSRSMQYREELEARNENPLLINSSVAFGSDDLDDFMLENERLGQGSVMPVLFHKKQEKNHEIEEDVAKFGSASSVGFASSGQLEEGKDKMDTENVEEIKDGGETETVKEVRGIPPSYCQVQGADKLTDVTDSSTHASTDFLNAVNRQVQSADTLVNCSKTSSITKAYDINLDLLAEEALRHKDLNATDGGNVEKASLFIKNEEAIESNVAQHVKNPELDTSVFRFDHFSDSRVDQSSSNPSNLPGNVNGNSFENLEQIVHPSNVGMRKTLESNSTSAEHLEKGPLIPKTEDFELNEFYDEVVQEMEDILLDSMDSPGARLAMDNRLFEPQLSIPSRDGGLTASTSSTDDAYLLAQRPARIDRIEVVGARQKKGDVSFSERLVGVKEYTVYIIKVWSGKDQWEVERRYRDFLSLCRCLKTLSTEQGWTLPLPWSSVEKGSKIFRSASLDIIAKRSVLIQECLQSILRTRFFSNPPRALISFLSPQDSHPVSHVSNAPVSHLTRWSNSGNFSTLGKTISLIVEIPPNKSERQLLEAQHYTCAGCHKNFDDGKASIWDFVQTFGWGKPRLCEYTGQLFCSSCHTNETAVLPARVLNHWDFTHYPVSQMAKSYLDSIHEQPMLCVTAVNPFLLSRVPALLHVMSVRKKIGIMLPYVRCPFRRSINRALGSRRYLLESNDFFALRDLIDLSKGVFAALPVMVETLSRKILEHITDQCLVCCDVGVPCNARQDCSDPSSLIFPFQEDNIERCKSCQSVFHKRCFKKLASCPCGVHLRLNETRSLTNRASPRGGDVETRGTLDLVGKGLSSGLSSRFLSGLFTKEKPEKKTREHRDENIILMGSLPSTSL